MQQKSSSVKDVVFKDGPLFDEHQYRQNFYRMVLRVQPVFAAFPEEVLKYSESIPTKSKENNEGFDFVESCSKRFEYVIEQKLREKVADKNNQNVHENSVTKEWIQSLESSLNIIEKVNDALRKEDNAAINQLFAVETVEIMQKLHDLLSEIYCLLHVLFIDPDDEFAAFYILNYEQCLGSLAEGSKANIWDAFSFSTEIYNNNKGTFFKKILKSKRSLLIRFGLNMKDSNKILEATEKITNILQAVREICQKHMDSGDIERSKRDLLSRKYNTETIANLAHPLYVHFKEKIQDVISKEQNNYSHGSNFVEKSKQIHEQFTRRKSEREFIAICQFSKENINDYIDLKTIRDFETYIDQYLNTDVQRAIELLKQSSFKGKIDDITSKVLNELAGTQPRTQIIGLNELFSKEQMDSRIKVIMADHSQLWSNFWECPSVCKFSEIVKTIKKETPNTEILSKELENLIQTENKSIRDDEVVYLYTTKPHILILPINKQQKYQYIISNKCDTIKSNNESFKPIELDGDKVRTLIEHSIIGINKFLDKTENSSVINSKDELIMIITIAKLEQTQLESVQSSLISLTSDDIYTFLNFTPKKPSMVGPLALESSNKNILDDSPRKEFLAEAHISDLQSAYTDESSQMTSENITANTSLNM